MSDVQIHWFSIINSVVIVLFLSGMNHCNIFLFYLIGIYYNYNYFINSLIHWSVHTFCSILSNSFFILVPFHVLCYCCANQILYLYQPKYTCNITDSYVNSNRFKSIRKDPKTMDYVSTNITEKKIFVHYLQHNNSLMMFESANTPQMLI